jgi:hypothetical protein
VPETPVKRAVAQLIATAALLPAGKRAVFVQRVAAALAAGETSVLNAIAVAIAAYHGPSQVPTERGPVHGLGRAI